MNAALEAAHLKLAEMKAAGIKVVPLNPIEKARRNPQSLRCAIDGKCFDCVGAGHDPNPRGAIRDCAISDCTLWPVRPYQRRDSGIEVLAD
jgi:hypothetical protein